MKVAFYQPRHFNRTERKTNPFFDPIISACERNGIPYRIYQPYRRPDTGYRKVCSSSNLRKFVRFFRWSAGRFMKGRREDEVDRLAGKAWNMLTFGRYRADVYVTIAYELYGVWTGINPRARVVDVQHGIIYPGHGGYLDRDGSIAPILRRHPEREVWLSGEGYLRFFMANPESREWALRRCRVVGDVIGHAMAARDDHVAPDGGIVLFCLQLTGELPDESNMDVLRETVDFIKRYVAEGGDCGRLVLRHHPRYGGKPSLDGLLAEFPGVRVSNEPFGELMRRTAVHVTISSTTAFDAASFGVPTFFTGGRCCLTECQGSLDWGRDFAYPFHGMSFAEIADRVRRSPAETAQAMQDWFRLFYRKFDESETTRIIGGIDVHNT